MGQRSQIYLRYNGKLIFANYYQWNYGERMISRARWGIEDLKSYMELYKGEEEYYFADAHNVERSSRIFDVNFDMHDMAHHCDIIKEYWEWSAEQDFNESVFNGQDNNDGQLYIDIVDGTIYYCFRGWDWDSGKEIVMNAEQYMDWDYENWRTTDVLSFETKATCEKNMEAIKEMAKLMTPEQLSDFIHGDYTNKEETA